MGGRLRRRLEPPDYRFDLAKGVPPNVAVERMRQAHNRAYEAKKAWSYGHHYEKGVCAAASTKTPGCGGGGWTACGSNTYPAGFFPGCHSPLGVYDQHGNAAEHMNLPLNESQMASRGSNELGYTEMKGSWFIFDTYHAHEDWCRWRAPFWHGSRVMDPHSHENYHLGFRCCKTLREENRRDSKPLTLQEWTRVARIAGFSAALSGGRRISGHEVADLPERAFVAQQGRQHRVFQDLVDGPGLAVEKDRVADQADPVAVIRIVGAVDRAEGLDGAARRHNASRKWQFCLACG